MVISLTHICHQHDAVAAGSNAKRGDANMAKLDADTENLSRTFQPYLLSGLFINTNDVLTN